MRVLFSCVGAYGHFRPLVPLARAFSGAGHDVAFATSAWFAERVEAAGFAALGVAIDRPGHVERIAAHRASLTRLPPHERRPAAFAGRFGSIEAPAKLSGLRAEAGAWGPDVIVYESADLAAPLVAALLGVPAVHQGFGRLVPAICFERAATKTESLWRAVGLEPEPLGGVYRGTYVDIRVPR